VKSADIHLISDAAARRNNGGRHSATCLWDNWRHRTATSMQPFIYYNIRKMFHQCKLGTTCIGYHGSIRERTG